MRDDDTCDVVRDLAVDLGLGLVRMEERHHRIEDVFREGGAGSVQPRLSTPEQPARQPASSTTSATGHYDGPRLGARLRSRGRSS